MIKANELRINNLVKVKTSNDARIYTIVYINGLFGKVGLDGVRIGEVINIENIKPIRLTEKILYKCGFKPYGNGKWHHDAISLHEADFIFNSKSDRVKYVHQLQNLFYALTNEELEVNL